MIDVVPKPVMIRADELVITQGERGEAFREVPLVFDTSGDRAVVLIDARAIGGPILTFGLASTTSYAVAMALMQMRARLRRAARAETPPSPRSK
jgi:hypothetical protein